MSRAEIIDTPLHRSGGPSTVLDLLAAIALLLAIRPIPQEHKRGDDHRDNDKQDPRRPGIGLEERQGEGKKSRHFPSVATARGGSIASEIVHGTARRASVNSQRKTAHECSTHRPDIRLCRRPEVPMG